MLDLVSRQITSGRDMATARKYFHIATLVAGGEEKMFALAGKDGGTFHNSVEEWWRRAPPGRPPTAWLRKEAVSVMC